MKETQKEVIAYLEWYLLVSCPYCDFPIDLANGDYDNDWVVSEPIFNNKWDTLKGREFECEKCGEPFKLKSVEY